MSGWILLDDDPELDDVRSAVRGLGFEVAAPDSPHAANATVRVSSARAAIAHASAGSVRGPFHIVVTDRLSSTARRELARMHPDFVLERPIDPTVLGLLIRHALYAGPERRRTSRMPTRTSVRYRVGRTSRAAVLIEISEGGCRLETKDAIEPGPRMVVVLPPEFTGSKRLELAARVVTGNGRPARRSGSTVTSLAFLPQDAATRYALRRLIASGAASGGALQPHTRPAAGAATPVAGAPIAAPRRVAPADPPARRRSARGSYRRKILAAGAGEVHVLVGRDLSTGGMRVNPDPRLAVGQEFKLVVHGVAGRPPAVVKAVVSRDEGADGCVLRFHGVSSAVRARLEAIVRELPNARPADAPGGGPNVVVSEIVALSR